MPATPRAPSHDRRPTALAFFGWAQCLSYDVKTWELHIKWGYAIFHGPFIYQKYAASVRNAVISALKFIERSQSQDARQLLQGRARFFEQFGVGQIGGGEMLAVVSRDPGV